MACLVCKLRNHGMINLGFCVAMSSVHCLGGVAEEWCARSKKNKRLLTNPAQGNVLLSNSFEPLGEESLDTDLNPQTKKAVVAEAGGSSEKPRCLLFCWCGSTFHRAEGQALISCLGSLFFHGGLKCCSCCLQLTCKHAFRVPMFLIAAAILAYCVALNSGGK